MGSASSTATGATLPSFGRFVYTRIKTATQDAQQRIEEGKEVWLKHLLPVLPEADPGVQGGLRHHRQRQGWHHHCPRPKKAFEGIGRPISDGEANNMVGEAPGPINFTQMVTLFAEKMSGGTDDDDVIVRSFEAFEINGQIDAEMFRHSLMTCGEKFSSNEIDDAFREFKIDGGMIDAEHLKSIMVAKKDGGDKISLSMNLIVKKRLRPKMGLFLDGQENATCDKISFQKQAPTSINHQLLGQSQ